MNAGSTTRADEALPVSVLIPTIGREPQLRACLESLARCDRRADEILVIDQSGSDEIPRLVGDYASIGARVVHCSGRGLGLADNVGLDNARNEIVLGTHDDCAVAADWISKAWAAMAGDPKKLVTGRVLPGAADPRTVPSTKDDPAPRELTGELLPGLLYPANMAVSRTLALELGGFDERIEAAEDNDFCYRWLRAGNRMFYDPSLVVTHNEWRTHEELERLYVKYWHSQGVFYAKHLRRGDLHMLRFIALDVRYAATGVAARVFRGRPRWADWRRGIVRGLPAGLIDGWRRFGSDTHERVAPHAGRSG